MAHLTHTTYAIMESNNAVWDGSNSPPRSNAATFREENLWSKAMKRLSGEDRERIASTQADKLNALRDILAVAENNKDSSIQKQWKVKRSDSHKEPIVIREVFGKIANSINKFKEVGDVLVQYDPAHASIPWAAVRFVLQVCFTSTQISNT